MEDVRAARAGRRDDLPRAFYYPEDRVAFFRHVAGYTRGSSSSTSTRACTTPPGSSATCGWPGSRLAARRGYLVPQSMRLPGPRRGGPARARAARRGGRARAAPARAVALRGGAVPPMSQLEKFDRARAGLHRRTTTPTPARYTVRRARGRDRGSGRRCRPGATVLDLACGDANMAEPLLALGYRYRGVDGSAAMIDEARAPARRPRAARRRADGRVRAAGAGRHDAVPARLLLRAPTGARSSAASPATRGRSSSSTSTRAPTTAAEMRARPARERLRRVELRPFFLPQRSPCPARRPRRAARRSSTPARSRAPRCACAASGSSRLSPATSAVNLKPTCAPSWRGSLTLGRNVGVM